MNIHQILINDSNTIPKVIPKYATICKNQFLSLYPQNNYKLYCGEEIEEIIKNNFPKEVITSYYSLNPYSYKADLAKYCILYLYGGFYFDLPIFFLSHIPKLEEFDFFAFRDRSKHSIKTWGVASGIIYSKPRCPIMKTCIETVVMHCKQKYYGIDVSGPVVLGESVVLNYRENINHAILGERMSIPKNYLNDIKMSNKILKDKIFDHISEGFVSDITNEVVCLCKSSDPGDIQSIGFDGTNNYLKMWKENNVYNQNIKFDSVKYFYL